MFIIAGENSITGAALQTLQKWVLERKLTSRVEDLAPSMSLGHRWRRCVVGKEDGTILENLEKTIFGILFFDMFFWMCLEQGKKILEHLS